MTIGAEPKAISDTSLGRNATRHSTLPMNKELAVIRRPWLFF
jgi:hypothetical protein